MKSPPFILCEPPLSGIPPFYPTQTRGVRSCSACSHAYREAPVRWTGASFFCQFCGGIRGGQSRPPLRREALSLREAQRRGNPFSARRRRADGMSGTPSPSFIHSPIHHRGLFQFSVPSFRSNSAWMRRRSTACSGAVRRGSASIRVWAASRASARSGISQLRSAAFSVGRPC